MLLYKYRNKRDKGKLIMKDYKKYIDLDYTQDLLNTLVGLECETFTIEGVLNDTHLINTEDLQRKGYKLGRIKFRKYLILGHEFASECHNHLYMKLTDNDRLFKELYKEYEEQQKD